jgi:Zn-dependent M28 family amino/carboxypeptidase
VDEIDAIALYVNADTIGSPNFARFIYDGDGSEFGVPGPPGSDDIEALFEGFYASRGLAFEATEIATSTTDLWPFFNAGIPVGGVFTGAFGIKTPEQAAIYGGTAGDQYDPCSGLACDTFDNVSFEALDQNADALAYATLHYAMSSTP